MNTPITHKLFAVVVAVLMNGVVLGSVDYLFSAPATTTSQAAQAGQGVTPSIRGIA